jgi:NAD(P)-dependent dehydrogenase (short-subunit alcohol dehydrogenase family)
MSNRWSAADIPAQTGRVAVVTGANSGLGMVTARELARAGALVVLACRDPERGASAVAAIRAEVPTASLDLRQLDLASQASVREFSSQLATDYDGLDLLINNAGVMAPPRRLTEDGFESQFGINHLGHFALTGRLIGLLAARPHSRVVTVSSGLHKIGRIAFEDLHGERRYGKWSAYGQSKLANLLFAFELDRRLGYGPPRSYAVHPGYSATNLQRTAAKATGSALTERFIDMVNKVVAQDMAMGALPSLYAATFPDLPGGSFIGPDGLREMRGHPKIVRAAKTAYDVNVAQRLWGVSAELTHGAWV